MLGEKFPGVLVRDGWAAYNFVECPQQQCLVHIHRDLRDLEAQKGIRPHPLLEERLPVFTRRGHPPEEFLRFAERLRGILREAILFQERVPDMDLRLRMAEDSRRRLNRLLKRDYHDPDAAKMAEGLRRRQNQLFTFLRYPKGMVPWHNNECERALRHSVVVRKMSFGSRSWKGAKCHATLRSVEETCRRRG